MLLVSGGQAAFGPFLLEGKLYICMLLHAQHRLLYRLGMPAHQHFRSISSSEALACMLLREFKECRLPPSRAPILTDSSGTAARKIIFNF